MSKKDRMWIADGFCRTPEIENVWNAGCDLLKIPELEAEIKNAQTWMEIHGEVKNRVVKHRDDLENLLNREKSAKKLRVLETLILSMMPQEMEVRETLRKATLRYRLLKRRLEWLNGNKNPCKLNDFPYTRGEIRSFQEDF